MRKLCLTMALLLALASPAAAQNWANKIFGGDANAPVLQDFGNVARGAQLTAQLQMTNIYKVPLNITDIRVSCGCVEAKPSTKTLKPNEVATLEIKLDGTRLTGGPKAVNVYVTFGPQFVSTANIVVSANARQDVVLNPGAINFGSVQRGSENNRSLEVEYAGAFPWKVTQVARADSAPFEIKTEVLPPHGGPNGVKVVGYRIIASLKPDAPLGDFRDTVDLITNDKDQPKVSFTVSGKVLPLVSVVPNPVQMSGLKVGATSNTKIVAQSNQAFRITGIQGAGNDIKLSLPDRSQPTHVLDLSVTPQSPGAFNREIILQTDLRNETVKLVIQGNVAP